MFLMIRTYFFVFVLFVFFAVKNLNIYKNHTDKGDAKNGYTISEEDGSGNAN